jgi:hypothetical protein
MRENVREVYIRNQPKREGKKIKSKEKQRKREKGKKEIYTCFVYFNIFGIFFIKCKW